MDQVSDGSQWGQIPKTIQNPPPGHDLRLRDDHEAFVVAFQYENKSFQSCPAMNTVSEDLD